jgi:MoxR-like ATPase
MSERSDWRIYRGTGSPHDDIDQLPPPPPWRSFDGTVPDGAGTAPSALDGPRPGTGQRARVYLSDEDVVEMVNAALYLRRPLLVTGKPGTGKSTLAYNIAYELNLGPVLYWPITSRSQLKDALYSYDAIGRLQAANLHRLLGQDADDALLSDIGRYLKLGPLGTALLPRRRPRVLLVDELDKSDIDLPNDLLNVFEEGEFDIPELGRLATSAPVEVMADDPGARAPISDGLVRCAAFPFIVITSNGEREFPPAFLRRCVRVTLQQPSPEKLARIVAAQLGEAAQRAEYGLISEFVSARDGVDLATDQLLNAVYLVSSGVEPEAATRRRVVRELFRGLGSTTGG